MKAFIQGFVENIVDSTVWQEILEAYVNTLLGIKVTKRDYSKNDRETFPGTSKLIKDNVDTNETFADVIISYRRTYKDQIKCIFILFIVISVLF